MINRITQNLQSNNYNKTAKLLNSKPIQIRNSQLISKSFNPTFTGTGQIRNFSQVSERLFRSGNLCTTNNHKGNITSIKQICELWKNMKYLSGNNIKTIVNLRSKESFIERKIARIFGIKTINIPINPYIPAKKHVEKALQIFDNICANTKDNILFHCFEGIDRTGFIIANIRVARDNWPVKDAIDEMIGKFRHEPISYPELTKFIREHAESFKKSTYIDEFLISKTASLTKQSEPSSITAAPAYANNN